MRRSRSVILLCLALALTAVTLSAAEKAPAEVIEHVHKNIVPLGLDAIVVEAARSANAAGKTLAQIQELDEKWVKTPGVAPFMAELLDSACGRHLRALQSENPAFAEIFVMDGQGALVAASDKTSDYWQGDEAKFTESFKNGQGAVFVDDVDFDESTQTYVVQASVPVVDGDKVIGALTVSIDLDEFEKLDE